MSPVVLRKIKAIKSNVSPQANDVTIVTQCSIDRLGHLEEQARCWSSAISAAVYVPHPSKTVLQQLRSMHAKVEQTTKCQLSMILATDQHIQSLTANETPYPINSLRNMALLHARTEVIILLDVDLLPHMELSTALTLDNDLYQSVVRSCCTDRTVFVLPAFEPIVQANSIEEGAIIAKESIAGGKAVVAQKLSDGQLSPFASSVFPQGHGSTDHKKWLKSPTPYAADYKEGFEPYIMCSRRLVPWYDERFAGYGKNKIIHIYHLACLGFKFTVHPNWYVVSLLHPPSQSWRKALGPDRISGLFHKTKLLYEEAKMEIRSGFMPDAGRTTLVPIKDRVPRGMGEWAHWNIPSKLNDLPLAYLRSICELRLMYQTRSLTSIMKLLSPCRPEGDDVTLVTTCTPDRLKRLEYVVEAWNGPVCVAVYYRRQFGCKFTSCEHLISRLKKWHSTVCKRKKIVDLSLVVDDKQHVQHIAPIGTVASGEQPEDCNDCTLLRTRYRGQGKRVPINSMRNSALELANTDLVFLLDVDLVPCADLHPMLQSITQNMGSDLERTALIVPAFEIKPEGACNQQDTLSEKADASATIQSINQAEAGAVNEENISSQSTIPLLHPRQPTLDNILQKNWVECTMDMLRHVLMNTCASNGPLIKPPSADTINFVTSIAHGGLDSLLPLIHAGRAILFHSENYPIGHCPTDVNKWLERTRDNDECYSVDYVEGYEPFVVVSKKSIPKFEEKFAGYGYDKVSFCLNLHMMGFSFHVIPGTFTVDIPHKRSRDWMLTFGPNAQKLQIAMIQGLYSRFRRLLALKFSSWPCQSESDQDLLPGTRLVSQRPQLQPDVPLECRARVWCGGFDEEVHSMLTAAQLDKMSLPWSALGWNLSAKQGLNNCALSTETVVNENPNCDGSECHKAILTVFLPSGTWCPSGCLSHGIPIGGVAARHRLARGLSGTVLRYRIRFEQGFPWALGGALPGLYCNRGQGFRVNIGWRSNGLGRVITTNASQDTPLETKSQFEPVGASTAGWSPNSPRWYFTKGQWHSVQILLSLAGLNHSTTKLSSKNSCSLHRSTGKTKIWVDEQIVHDKVYSLSPKADMPESNGIHPHRYGFNTHANNRQDEHRIDGVLFTCFYGGSTQEWAAPNDTNVHFSDFEIWANGSEQCP